MKISKQELFKKAQIEKFRPEILEKVFCLFEVLEEVNKHPFLKNRIALKGGTALNLFYFNVPRLSVDIDFNYIGAVEKSKMLLERPLIEKALESVFSKLNFYTIKIPQKHAGGKWRLKYKSYINEQGNLEVDLNYMFRLPFYSPERKNSKLIGNNYIKNILLINYKEIAAGKLTALLARKASRDLFDVYNLLLDNNLNFENLKTLLCLYGAMSSIDFRNVSSDKIIFEKKELLQKLIPVLRINQNQWKNNLSFFVEECRKKIEKILSFSNEEKKFLNLLYEEGKIEPSLLTKDYNFIEKIKNQPLLKWKSFIFSKV